MLKLERALTRHRQNLLDLPNVVGVGQGFKNVRGRDTGTPAIVIMVKEKLPAFRLQREEIIPKVLDDVETDVIEVGDIRLLSRTAYHRPAQPGMSIGHYKITAGTFGAVVRDRRTGEPMILSNNHVLANTSNGVDGRASIGDPIYQPGPYDGGTKDHIIGYLERFVPINPVVQTASCPKAARVQEILTNLIQLFRPDYRVRLQKVTSANNLVDCAVARPARKDLIKPEILELGKINGVREAKVGMEIVKSGRSSGLTRSTVKLVQATVKVGLDEGMSGTFTDQLVTGQIAKPGDSGSLVLDNENYAVGLLFAGSDKTSVSNPIANVLKQLDVEL